MIEHLFTADAMIALLTLTFLEIVLGIDNVIFISIVTGKLPEQQRKKATRGYVHPYPSALMYLLASST